MDDMDTIFNKQQSILIANVQVDGKAEVVLATVHKKSRQKISIVIVKMVAHKIGSQHRLNGFIGKEIYGEIGQADQARAEIGQQR